MSVPDPLRYAILDSPIGELLLAGDGRALRYLHMLGGRKRMRVAPDWERRDETFTEVRRQLAEYFSGTRTEFELQLEPSGTPFQLRVWNALREIPYGTTISYGELAARIGQPGMARAVGAANGSNPIAVIVPCHRVIGADGSLTGYGGGLPRKRLLLDLEAGQTSLLSPVPARA
jgi:methylated-DNA-[protein]-cysteine S-methyltransferase